MRLPSLPAMRLIPALFLVCVLCACGGGSSGGVFTPNPPPSTPDTPTPPDTGVKPVMRCAP